MGVLNTCEEEEAMGACEIVRLFFVGVEGGGGIVESFSFCLPLSSGMLLLLLLPPVDAVTAVHVS